jgi:energy-coupling factor transporter ATP-binding protein EcfA2
VNDPPADPFGERVHGTSRWRCRLLGADFVFETDNKAVERLVRQSFEALPRYRLTPKIRALHVRIVLRQRRASSSRAAPLPPRFAGGADIVTATIDADNYAVLAPLQGSALLVLSSDMLRYDYHLRYELLEFAVITLAVRALGLVPLHAACVSLRGRGVLLVGASGSGKSTLSMNAAAAGLALVSEDSLFVEPRRLRAVSLPNYLYVRSGTPSHLLPGGLAGRLARAPLIRRRSGVRKRALDLRHSGLAVARRAPRIVAMMMLTSRPARAGRLAVRQPAGRALTRLRAMQAYAAARPEWPLFARRMAQLPCFELRRGAHPAEAIAVLKALLRHMPNRH